MGKNCPCGKVGAVSFNMEGGVVIGEEEDGLGDDGSFEGVKGVLLRCFPMPHAILDGEVKQQMWMVRKLARYRDQ